MVYSAPVPTGAHRNPGPDPEGAGRASWLVQEVGPIQTTRRVPRLWVSVPTVPPRDSSPVPVPFLGPTTPTPVTEKVRCAGSTRETGTKGPATV